MHLHSGSNKTTEHPVVVVTSLMSTTIVIDNETRAGLATLMAQLNSIGLAPNQRSALLNMRKVMFGY